MRAQEEDPTIFMYDEVYEEMQQKKEEKKPQKVEKKVCYIMKVRSDLLFTLFYSVYTAEIYYRAPAHS